MDSSSHETWVEHEVVTDYLNSRDDRDKFNYFRIVDALTKNALWSPIGYLARKVQKQLARV